MGEAGQLGLFEPTPEGPREISRFQVPGMKYPCWTAPVLSDGRLFLRSEDQLLSYQLRKP